MTLDELVEKARNTVKTPGVYLMKKGDQILYIGKAKNLSRRLQSYFRNNIVSPRTRELVRNIEYFDVILTATELDALKLEAQLIFKHQPKYNIKLKEEKSYPYIKINLQHPAPRLEWHRGRIFKSDKVKFFGPYPEINNLREIIDLINRTLKLRTCNDYEFQNRGRPCILYQLDYCSGPCTGQIESKDYKQTVKRAMMVLSGQTKRLLQELKQNMQGEVDREAFEEAAKTRDLIRSVEKINFNFSIVDPNKRETVTIADVIIHNQVAVIGLLELNEGRVYNLKYIEQEQLEPLTESEILFDFLYTYKRQGLEKIIIKPSISFSNGLPTSTDSSEKNQWYKNLMQLLESNLLNYERHHQESSLSALEEMKDKLQLQAIPWHIECLDISHLQGSFTVGSVVAFIEGKPTKSYYRRYRIKTDTGGNDPLAIREVLTRKFSNKVNPFPNLLIIDGGMIQVQEAARVLKELNIQGVELVGLAKDRVKSDFKSSESVHSGERIVYPDGRVYPLEPRMASSKIIIHLRDEAHRFALKYHRELRSKNFIGRKNQYDE